MDISSSVQTTAKIMARYAWSSYYPTKLAGENTAKIADELQWDPPNYPCLGKTKGAQTPESVNWTYYDTADVQRYGVWAGQDKVCDKADCTDRNETCTDEVDGWEFQGRVITNMIGGGDARADVYYKNDACLVAIAGTKDTSNMLFDALAGTSVEIDAEGSPWKEEGKVVAMGFKKYYQAIRPKLNSACEGKTSVTVTGHSLGAAATMMMHAFGDADTLTASRRPRSSRFWAGRPRRRMASARRSARVTTARTTRSSTRRANSGTRTPSSPTMASATTRSRWSAR